MLRSTEKRPSIDVFPRSSSEEINKRLKSKAEESGVKSEEEGEIDEGDDDSDPEKSKKNTIRASQQFDNDIYAEDDDDEDDDYRSSTNRRKQTNASKLKETEHSKSLQLLVEGRKKKQGNFPNDDTQGDEANPPTEEKKGVRETRALLVVLRCQIQTIADQIR